MYAMMSGAHVRSCQGLPTPDAGIMAGGMSDAGKTTIDVAKYFWYISSTASSRAWRVAS